MSRKRTKAPHARELEDLLEAGDHLAARAVARTRLAAGGSDPEAQAVLASLAPDPGAVLAGIIAVAVAVVLAAWTILAG